jgi:hypothetical protein
MKTVYDLNKPQSDLPGLNDKIKYKHESITR